MKAIVRPRGHQHAPTAPPRPCPGSPGWTTTRSAPAASARGRGAVGGAVVDHDDLEAAVGGRSPGRASSRTRVDGVAHRCRPRGRRDHHREADGRPGRRAGRPARPGRPHGPEQDPAVTDDPDQDGHGDGDQLQAEQRRQRRVAHRHDQDLEHGQVGRPGDHCDPAEAPAGRRTQRRRGPRRGRSPGAARRTRRRHHQGDGIGHHDRPAGARAPGRAGPRRRPPWRARRPPPGRTGASVRRAHRDLVGRRSSTASSATIGTPGPHRPRASSVAAPVDPAP